MDIKSISEIAVRLCDILKPYCKRIAIAGSIRRKKQDCKDVEIVAIPNKYHLEKFLMEKRLKPVWYFYKNGAYYKQFKFDGVMVDLFLCSEDNWGWIYFLRTGSEKNNIEYLTAFKKKTGGNSDKGYLRRPDGSKIITKEEQDVFDLIGKGFIAPIDRNL
jgi:DNA polymerase/3'-5' exonuclease PolX